MSDFEEFEQDLKERAGKTEPSLEEIAVKQCGCRCGVENCEFAGDFFNEQGIPSEEFGNDEDLLSGDNGAVSVNAIEYGFSRFAEEYADEFNALGRKDELAEELVTETEDYNEFGEEVHLTGDMAVNQGGVTDDIEYRDTAEFQMIDPDGEAFDTMGS